MLCYSNNGLSFRSVDPSYQAQSGEVLFSSQATSNQLSAAFSSYASLVATSQNTLACKTALDASDTTMLRIAEAISLGSTTWTTADVVAWVEYRRSLRAGTLATKPPYPVGT